MLIQDGEVLDDALRGEEMTRDDLLVEIQSAGAATLDDVRTASLLPSGKVIVVPKETNQASLQYDDLRARIDHLTDAGRGAGAGDELRARSSRGPRPR